MMPKVDGIKLIRVLHMIIRGFWQDQCSLHAASLTFSTLMSIVPVLAVSLALARGFGAGDQAESQIRKFIRDKMGATAPSTNVALSVAAPAASAKAAAYVETNALGAATDATEGGNEALSERVDMMLGHVFDSVRNINFAKLGGIGLAILIFSVVQVLGRVEYSFNRIWGGRWPRHRCRSWRWWAVFCPNPPRPRSPRLWVRT